MRAIIAPNFAWKKTHIDGVTLHYAGDLEQLKRIVGAVIRLGPQITISALHGELGTLSVPGAAIFQFCGLTIAFVDHFRCYPIFYRIDGKAAISNNARELTGEAWGKSAWKQLSAEEFAMTGYVTGHETLIDGLYQLQSGECMIYRSGRGELDIKRYYRYEHEPGTNSNVNQWIEELDSVMESVTDRMISRAKGRPVRITLSAGLDSRVLVAKFCERGYDNLETFSYGPKHNWEARGARIVASRLDVPWRFVGVSNREARMMFWSEERKDYWRFADGLSAQANFQEYFAIKKLRKEDALPEDVILINGQSGDFISGGHIPVSLYHENADVRSLLTAITAKHYGLWLTLMTPERLQRIETKLLQLLGVSLDDDLSPEELCSLYERWECEERQVKWVIHAQRVNDFFGYDWQLPLWDIELARFFQRVPFKLKLNQRLYRMWLEKWNYKGLFRGFNPTVWRWPGLTLAVVPAAKIVEVLFGKRAKRNWYDIFAYWGHTTEHYAPYRYRDYFAVRSKIRNCIALNCRTWANENRMSRGVVDVGQIDFSNS